MALLELLHLVGEAERTDVVIADLRDAGSPEVLVQLGAPHPPGAGAERGGEAIREGAQVDPRRRGDEDERQAAIGVGPLRRRLRVRRSAICATSRPRWGCRCRSSS